MNPLHDLYHAYAIILQEENQRDFSSQAYMLYNNAVMSVRFTHQNKSKPS